MIYLTFIILLLNFLKPHISVSQSTEQETLWCSSLNEQTGLGLSSL